jgi:hypothetical protein
MVNYVKKITTAQYNTATVTAVKKFYSTRPQVFLSLSDTSTLADKAKAYPSTNPFVWPTASLQSRHQQG